MMVRQPAVLTSQMQQVYDKQEKQSQRFRNDLTRDAAAISRIAESLDRLDHALAK